MEKSLSLTIKGVGVGYRLFLTFFKKLIVAFKNFKLYIRKTKNMKKKLEIEEQKAQDFFCVKTFEDALSYLSKRDKDVLIYQKMVSNKIFGHTLVYQKLTIIVKALNQDWTPNWNNGNEIKWFPYFHYKASSGFVFFSAAYGSWNTFASCSALFCLKSEALAKYCGTQFIELFNDLLKN